MLNFNNETVFLKRPVTLESVGEALGVRGFELMADCIHLEIFIAPHQELKDDELHALGNRICVKFQIDEDGGSSTKPIRPVSPTTPPKPSQQTNQNPCPSE